MLIRDILNLSKEELEDLDLHSINLDIDKEPQKVMLLTQWHKVYNRRTTSIDYKLAIEESLARLLNV